MRITENDVVLWESIRVHSNWKEEKSGGENYYKSGDLFLSLRHFSDYIWCSLQRSVQQLKLGFVSLAEQRAQCYSVWRVVFFYSFGFSISLSPFVNSQMSIHNFVSTFILFRKSFWTCLPEFINLFDTHSPLEIVYFSCSNDTFGFWCLEKTLSISLFQINFRFSF